MICVLDFSSLNCGALKWDRGGRMSLDEAILDRQNMNKFWFLQISTGKSIEFSKIENFGMLESLSFQS